MSTDTPRTDKAEHDCDSIEVYVVDADFARTLERELTAAKAEIARLNENLDRLTCVSVDARARVAELEQDKARLDWLIKDACIVEPTPKADAKLHIFTGPMHSRQYERAAIDAARTGKGAP